MAVPVHYVTKQAILEEAGLSQPILAEPLSGLANGSNKVFTTLKKPLADTNYDDTVDMYDVVLYVNGSSAPIASVDGPSGTITAVTAPANAVVVTADYRYSPLLDAYVSQVSEEAEDYIASNMDVIDPLPYKTVPPTIRKIARWYAAGMLLAKDYGFQRDTSQTSKDGEAKIAQAEKWLDAYIATGGSTGLSDVSAAEVTTASDPALFTDYDRSAASYVSPDEAFMLDPDVGE